MNIESMKQYNTRANGDKTRDSIIKAARALFAKNGFAGTSIMQIAAKAKVTKALIFHHFKNKEELWKMVKASFLNNLSHSTHQAISPDKTLPEFIEHIINQRFDLYNRNPDVVRMLIWQNMEKQTGKLQGGTSASPDQWIATIKQLQKQKEIKPELDVELVVLFIASTISGAFMSGSILLDSENKKAAYKNLVINNLYNFLSVNK